jgi:hypothetical protein
LRLLLGTESRRRGEGGVTRRSDWYGGMKRGSSMALPSTGSERLLRLASDGKTKTTLLGEDGLEAGEPGREAVGLEDPDDGVFLRLELPAMASKSILARTLSVLATRWSPSGERVEDARSAGANCWSTVKPSEPSASRNCATLRVAVD